LVEGLTRGFPQLFASAASISLDDKGLRMRQDHQLPRPPRVAAHKHYEHVSMLLNETFIAEKFRGNASVTGIFNLADKTKKPSRNRAAYF
jgi:hypothetical protein